MPFSHRPHDSDSGYGTGRKIFRTITDFKRSPKNPGNGNGSSRASGRPAPPEATNAEAFYYVKQMSSKTQMVIVMTDGEEIRGCIEWYDRNCLKINREGAPNLLIQKHYIKYMFKADELAE